MTATEKLENLRKHDPSIAIRIMVEEMQFLLVAIRVMDGRVIESETYKTGDATNLPLYIDEAVHDLMHRMLAYQSKPFNLEGVIG